MSVTKVWQANDLASAPADRSVESRMRMDRRHWVYGWNLSPYVIEIQNETGTPETLALPFTPFVHPLDVQTEKLIFHVVATMGGTPPIPAATWAVYYTLSEFQPELIAAPDLASPDQGMAAPNVAGNGWLVRIQDGASAILATVLASDGADGIAPGTATYVRALGALFNGNGSQNDRARDASALNLGAQSGIGAALVAPPGSWSVVSAPAAGTQASASRAAGGAGVRHVYRSALITWGAIAAPVATLLQGNVRDGATGAGTVIDAAQLAVPAVVFQGAPVHMGPDKSVPGTAATAMTAETSAALAALAAGASLQGYDAS